MAGCRSAGRAGHPKVRPQPREHVLHAEFHDVAGRYSSVVPHPSCPWAGHPVQAPGRTGCPVAVATHEDGNASTQRVAVTRHLLMRSCDVPGGVPPARTIYSHRGANSCIPEKVSDRHPGGRTQWAAGRTSPSHGEVLTRAWLPVTSVTPGPPTPPPPSPERAHMYDREREREREGEQDRDSVVVVQCWCELLGGWLPVIGVPTLTAV